MIATTPGEFAEELAREPRLRSHTRSPQNIVAASRAWRIMQMRSDGMRDWKIAETLGINKSRVSAIAREWQPLGVCRCGLCYLCRNGIL